MKRLYRLNLSIFISIIPLLFIFSSCKKDKNNESPAPKAEKSLVGSAAAVGSGTKVEIYTDQQDIMTGYNKVYFKVLDSASNNEITNATVTFTPMMDMGTMMHSAPMYQAGNYANGYYQGAVVFVMPSTAGTWMLNVKIMHNNKMGIASIPVTVSAPAEANLMSFESENDSSDIFITLIEPTSPQVGMNDIKLGIYKRVSMMDWQEVNNYSVGIEPWMPTMGHGSPNNVNPTSMGDGFYMGKVNFTMTGLWEIKLTIMDGSDMVKNDISFQMTLK